MKKIILFIIILISLKSFGQTGKYPNYQSFGSDSTLVESKGALKSRLVNRPFTDTTQANTQRIKWYEGAQAWTTSDKRFWIRDSLNNKWILPAGTGGGGGSDTANLIVANLGLGIPVLYPRNDTLFGGTFIGGTGITLDSADGVITVNATGGIYTGGSGISIVVNDIRNDLTTGLAVTNQTIVASTISFGDLTLSTTSHASKGNIFFGTSSYNEGNNSLGIRTASPTSALHITANVSLTDAPLRIDATTGAAHAMAMQINASEGGGEALRDGASSGYLPVRTGSSFGVEGAGYSLIGEMPAADDALDPLVGAITMEGRQSGVINTIGDEADLTAANLFVLRTGTFTPKVTVNFAGNFAIGDNLAPTEKLHVGGNIRFSGALMPNNLPGTAGQFLTSAGAGAPPTWTTGSGGGGAGNDSAYVIITRSADSTQLYFHRDKDNGQGIYIDTIDFNFGIEEIPVKYPLQGNDDTLQISQSWQDSIWAAMGGGGVAWGGITGTLSSQTDLQTALNLKSNIASPTFTGLVTTPLIKITSGVPGVGKVLTSDADGDATWEASGASGEANTGSNLGGGLANYSTKVGVDLQFNSFAAADFDLASNLISIDATKWAVLASPTFTGTPTLPTGTIGVTQSAGNSTTALATTAFVTTADNLKANLASPTFTGTVVIPTPFTLGATSVTSTGTQLNYLSGATGTTGTNTTNLVFSAAPTFTGTTIFSTGIQSATIKSAATGSASNLWIPSSDGATINQTTSQLLFGGGSEVSYRFAEAGSFSTVLGVNDVYASHIIGIQPFTEAASGTHAFVSQFVVNPLLGTAGSAATTDAATLFINGAMTGVTPSGRNDAFRVSGTSYFDGTVTMPTPFTLGAVSVLPTGTELNFVDGVTSAIQTQLDSKQGTITLTTTGTSGAATLIGSTLNIPQYTGGGGDMVLASVQTVTGAKTFNDTKLLLRNVAGTFNGSFVNTNTADRIYTLKDAAGTLAFTSDITGTNSGTNTGDQTTIAGITGTTAQFNTANTDADFLTTAAAVTVAQGGTGAATLTGILVGNGTSAVTAVAGTASQVLRRNAGNTAYEFFTLSGGGDALTSNPLSQFAATTSTQLLGVINDETGTDKLVFSADPTLTGTPLAPTAAAGTNTTQIATTAFVLANSMFTSFSSAANLSFVDATTYYFGVLQNTTTPLTSVGNRRTAIPVNCTLIGYLITTYPANGGVSSEASTVSIRINNTTDVQLSNAVTFASTGGIPSSFYSMGMSTSINAGDDYEVKILTPTWTTNPTTAQYTVTLYFRTR